MSNQYSTLIRVRELHTLINLHITAQLDFNQTCVVFDVKSVAYLVDILTGLLP